MKKLQSFLLILIVVFSLSCKKEESRTSNNNNNGSTSTCSGGPSSVTDIDGNVYNVVTIGNQCWMKENLKTTKYRNGDAIPTNLNNTQWQNTTQGAWAYYNDSSQYNNIYGKLYNWYAVADARGVCPTGWHVPTESEWNVLVKYLDPQADTTINSNSQSSIAGGFLKEMGDLQSNNGIWEYPNSGATNSSGFSGLPGGRHPNEIASNSSFASAAFLWSFSNTNNVYYAWSRYLVYDGANIYRYYFNKQYGFSVRCLRD